MALLRVNQNPARDINDSNGENQIRGNRVRSENASTEPLHLSFFFATSQTVYLHQSCPTDGPARIYSIEKNLEKNRFTICRGRDWNSRQQACTTLIQDRFTSTCLDPNFFPPDDGSEFEVEPESLRFKMPLRGRRRPPTAPPRVGGLRLQVPLSSSAAEPDLIAR